MKISVIGAGAMGGATVEGLLKSDFFIPSEITVADPVQDTRDHFADKGVNVTPDNAIAAANADIVMVVVKPWLVEKVLKGIKDALDYSRQMLILTAAGIKSDEVIEWMEKDGQEMMPFFLVIPNIAIAFKASMTFIVPIGATPKQTKTICDIFDELGETHITEERLLGAGTALASSGIGYAMRYIRASSEGGVEMGFKASDAVKIVLQTFKGAVRLLQTTGEHPEAAIDKVTTPGGITIRGLNEMENAGFTAAVIRGLKAGLI